jgi:hypothetical protein
MRKIGGIKNNKHYNTIILENVYLIDGRTVPFWENNILTCPPHQAALPSSLLSLPFGLIESLTAQGIFFN